jgi:hypothetical protein
VTEETEEAGDAAADEDEEDRGAEERDGEGEVEEKAWSISWDGSIVWGTMSEGEVWAVNSRKWLEPLYGAGSGPDEDEDEDDKSRSCWAKKSSTDEGTPSVASGEGVVVWSLTLSLSLLLLLLILAKETASKLKSIVLSLVAENKIIWTCLPFELQSQPADDSTSQQQEVILIECLWCAQCDTLR